MPSTSSSSSSSSSASSSVSSSSGPVSSSSSLSSLSLASHVAMGGQSTGHESGDSDVKMMPGPLGSGGIGLVNAVVEDVDGELLDGYVDMVMELGGIGTVAPASGTDRDDMILAAATIFKPDLDMINSMVYHQCKKVCIKLGLPVPVGSGSTMKMKEIIRNAFVMALSSHAAAASVSAAPAGPNTLSSFSSSSSLSSSSISSSSSRSPGPLAVSSSSRLPLSDVNQPSTSALHALSFVPAFGAAPPTCSTGFGSSSSTGSRSSCTSAAAPRSSVLDRLMSSSSYRPAGLPGPSDSIGSSITDPNNHHGIHDRIIADLQRLAQETKLNQSEPQTDALYDGTDIFNVVNTNDPINVNIDREHISFSVLKAAKFKMVQWVEDAEFKHERNRYECLQLAKSIDFLLRGNINEAIEVLVRRLVGVHSADASGDWNMCSALEYDSHRETLLSPSLLNRTLRSSALLAKLNRQGSTTRNSNRYYNNYNSVNSFRNNPSNNSNYNTFNVPGDRRFQTGQWGPSFGNNFNNFRTNAYGSGRFNTNNFGRGPVPPVSSSGPGVTQSKQGSGGTAQK